MADEVTGYPSEGGDPSCWLGLLCPECGRVREDRSLDHCAGCGAPVERPGTDAGAER